MFEDAFFYYRQHRDTAGRAGNIVYLPPGQCYELREAHQHHHHHHPPTGHSSTSLRKATVRSASCSSSDQSSVCKDRRALASGGRRNVYAHNARMKSRPLPSIPDINAASSSTGEQGHPCGCRGTHRGGDLVELGPCSQQHLRASTLGRSASSNAQKSARTRRTRADSGGCTAFAAARGGPPNLSVSSPVPQHYTVLDPIEVQQQLTGTLRGAAGRTVTAAASPRGPSTSAAVGVVDPGGAYHSGASPDPPPKPPLLPSMEVAAAAVAARGRCGEGGIEESSCREITLRPSRQRVNFDRGASNSGGNSSWP